MAETLTDWMTEARARADATVASPFLGPGWQALHGDSWAGEHVVADESGHPLLIGGDGEMARADVDFAAHARQDLPRALDALEGVVAFLQKRRADALRALRADDVHRHADYWRWQGHAELSRQVLERLGADVPQ